MTPFTERYLLVSGLPYYLDEAGRVWLHRLWHRDLVLHLDYLPRATTHTEMHRRRAELLQRICPST
jgi:hypothetical protein